MAYPELSGNLADARHNEKSLWTPLESKPTDRQTWGVAPVTEPSKAAGEVNMRKTIAIVVGIVVAASCVPWLRHQHFFSVLVGLTAIVLIGFMAFGGLRALSARWRPQQASSAQSGWWSPRFRNLLLGAAFVLVLMLTVPHFMATNSGAYKLAVATAHQSPQFMEALGAPVAEAWFSEGKEEWGNPAKATLMVPVQGQKRQGNLRAVAVKVDGEWRLKELTLELSQPEEHIDLLGAASPAVQFVRCMTVVTSPLHSLTRGRPIRSPMLGSEPRQPRTMSPVARTGKWSLLTIFP